MPYSVVSNHPDCEGYAVVKDATNEVLGCHKTQARAEDQLTAINISEYGESRTENPESVEDKSRFNTALQILKELKKEI